MSSNIDEINETLDEIMVEDDELPTPSLDSFYGVGASPFIEKLLFLWYDLVDAYKTAKIQKAYERNIVRGVIEKNIVDFDNTNFNSLMERNAWDQQIRNHHKCNQARHLHPKYEWEAHQKFIGLLDKYDKDMGTKTGALVRDYLVKNLAVS